MTMKEDAITETVYEIALTNLLGAVGVFVAVGLHLGKGEQMQKDLTEAISGITGK